MAATPDFQYPAGDLDRADKLLALVGSFWSELYQGGDLVEGVLQGRARLDAQVHLDLLELAASISRLTVPVFHRENWYLLTLAESARGRTVRDHPRYGGGARYDAVGEIVYGAPLAAAAPAYSWTLPADLVEVPAALNRITDASLVWTCGVDYTVADGVITFAANPFDDDRLPVRERFQNNVVVDREVGLWVYRGAFDRDAVYVQFGYVLGRRLDSSAAYRDFVNALFDGIVQGTTQRCVQAALAALCDAALVREPVETVEAVFRDDRRLWVVTDAHAYGYSRAAAPLVQEGAVVHAGDPLVDALQIYEFGRGRIPTVDRLSALAVGRGFLAEGYYQDLVFANETVPLQVTAAPDGYTRVEFAVGGLPGDVARFWDDVHAAGVARNQTLAMLLDQRTVKEGQPTAAALPATVNPLEFLCGQLFRANLVVAAVRPAAFGPDALGLENGRLLRKLTPPHTALVVVARLEIPGDEITMEGPGDEAAVGYEETAALHLGLAAADDVDPAAAVDETVRLRQVRGRCI